MPPGTLSPFHAILCIAISAPVLKRTMASRGKQFLILRARVVRVPGIDRGTICSLWVLTMTDGGGFCLTTSEKLFGSLFVGAKLASGAVCSIKKYESGTARRSPVAKTRGYGYTAAKLLQKKFETG